MNKDDVARLRHMLDAARAALTFIEGQSRAILDTDQRTAFALLKAVEIIGEAASRVSEECRDRYPEIPWSQIIGMRNVLIHAYFDVDLDQLWDTSVKDLPPLVSRLEHILSPLDNLETL